MGKAKLDSRAIGLDVGLSLMKWLTGAENLHYGYWDGLEPSAQNLGAAQAAYTELLFSLLPDGPLRILDIGGGAGETARKLIALGHQVDIVVPSAFLASRCRENAPQATTHECTFEDFTGDGPFDLCLFSESFQYIPCELALDKAAGLLKPGGTILIADCFRSENYKGVQRSQTVGGGHRLSLMEEALAARPDWTVSHRQDITASVAGSIDVEQGLFNVLGHGVSRISDELSAKRPMLHRISGFLFRKLLGERRLFRLKQRLMEKTRTSEAFCHFNRYMIFRISV